jgi:3-oxoacyl-[acyl-carrier-protein] synthase-3
MKYAKIIGVGHYVPDNVVTNHDLVKMMDTSDEWIQERSGIIERRWIKEPYEQSTAHMGFEAAKMAIQRAGITNDEIELIVFATLSSDYYFPGPGVKIQQLLGIGNVGAIDVRAQCSGFIYAISVADQFVRTGMYKTVLVVGSETHSIGLDKTTRGRTTAVLFGDGAGAVVLRASETPGVGILSTHLHSQGEHAEKLFLKAPGTGRDGIIYPGIEQDVDNIYPVMDGQFVFKNAVVRMEEAVKEALNANGYKVSDLDMVLAHQANLRISQFVQRKLGLPDDKMYSNIQKYGNTTSATLPILMSELWEQGKITEGKLYALVAFGSGFTWASALIKW